MCASERNFTYTNDRARDAKAPEFPAGAMVTASDVGTEQATLTFPVATVTDGVSDGMVYRYLIEVTDTETGKLTLQVTTGDGKKTAEAAVPADQWLHVMATYDGKQLRLTLNGDIVATVACTGGTVCDANRLLVGADGLVGDGTLQSPARMAVGFLHLYDVGVSPKKTSFLYRDVDLHLNRPNFGGVKDENVTRGKKVTAGGSAYDAESRGIPNLTDGSVMQTSADGTNGTNGWMSNGVKNKTDETWAYVDLGQSYDVALIYLYPRKSGERFPRGYKVSLSTDAINWTTVFEEANDPGDLQKRVIEIDPTAARYVRISSTMLNSEWLDFAGGYIMQMSEIEVYAQ